MMIHEEEDITRMTPSGCIDELKKEGSINILSSLVMVKRHLRRMKARRTTGQIIIHVANGEVTTVVAPDSQQPPKDIR